jgi:hypothetical protein
MEKCRVTLVSEERAALELLVGSGRSASHKLTHARIPLLQMGCMGLATPTTKSSQPWASV